MKQIIVIGDDNKRLWIETLKMVLEFKGFYVLECNIQDWKVLNNRQIQSVIVILSSIADLAWEKLQYYFMQLTTGQDIFVLFLNTDDDTQQAINNFKDAYNNKHIRIINSSQGLRDLIRVLD